MLSIFFLQGIYMGVSGKNLYFDWIMVRAMVGESIGIHVFYWFLCKNRYTVIFIADGYLIFNVFNIFD